MIVTPDHRYVFLEINPNGQYLWIEQATGLPITNALCDLLIWTAEAYDASTHYDLLFREGGAGTVSLSYCPDRALPWPLRGVRPWRENDLLRVNSTVLQVEEAMAYLDFIWDERRILERLVNTCLVRAALGQDPIELSDGEIQSAMDAYRRAHQLYTPETTHAWLARRSMSHAQLEESVADAATAAKLRERVTAGQVDAYFAAHGSDFDTTRVAQLDCADEAVARRIAESVRGGDLDFYMAAEQAFLAGELRTEDAPLTFATLQRHSAPAAVAEAAFTAAQGDVVGPIAVGGSYRVLRVLESVPARLDAPTRRAVEQILFEQWLDERRAISMIEWNWGDAAKTAPVSQLQPVGV